MNWTPSIGMYQNGTPNQHGVDSREPLVIGNTATLTRTQPIQGLITPRGYGPSHVENLVLTLGVEKVTYDENQTDFSFPVVAYIQFGAGNGATEVEVDVRDGTQVSCVGQAISVRVQLEDTSDAAPLSTSISANIGIGSRAARSFNTRTILPASVPSGSALVVGVPRYAFSINVSCTTNIAFIPGNLQVQVFPRVYRGAPIVGNYYPGPPPLVLGSDPVLTLDGASFLQSQLTEGIKLPQGSGSVRVQNNSSETLVLSPFFGLSL